MALGRTACHAEVERTPKIARIMEMGFSAAEADGALRGTEDNLERAVQVLLSG